MKVAIPVYKNRVAPRIGFADGIVVVTLRRGEEVGREVLDLRGVGVLEIPRVLAQKGVTVLIGGGVERPVEMMFRAYNIDVIWGVIGNVEDVIALYKANGLFRGIGPCRRWRHGKGWRKF